MAGKCSCIAACMPRHCIRCEWKVEAEVTTLSCLYQAGEECKGRCPDPPSDPLLFHMKRLLPHLTPSPALLTSRMKDREEEKLKP